MCGITGIWAKNENGRKQLHHIEKALAALKHRGPNYQTTKTYTNCSFGHARLSIIDTDSRSNQPFISSDGRYTLTFNGEIYNYKTLKKELIQQGVVFRTESDTEVLMALLIHKGKKALNLLDGFFAFAFYDSKENTLLLARDRMGIKPLLIYSDSDKFIFASELQVFNAFEIDKEIDEKALHLYFGLTYIPAPKTIFKKVQNLLPGTYAFIKGNELEIGKYYSPKIKTTPLNYTQAKQELRTILTQSVRNRMVADVPLGCFLSGGVDSSIIAALACIENPKLRTFSIGFDHAYFNETNYANEVAKRIGSQHTVYALTQEDFKNNFTNFLNAINTPFADSSAFAVYLLAKKTKQEVTVALSGDGADELFGGYRKHSAEFQTRTAGTIKKAGVKIVSSVLRPIKSNRSDKIGEFNRKIQKFNKGLNLNALQRYWSWCQFINEKERNALFLHSISTPKIPLEITDFSNLNSILLADQELVLPNDMLKKVDLMSMAHALEVRTPFLDHKVVEFANNLPASYKINEKGGKMILKDAFADLLPQSVIERSKKGFEIPIKEWLSDEIDTILSGDLFAQKFIEKQAIFNYNYLMQLRKDWHKPNFADKIYLVWAIIVFQNWWHRTFNSFKIY